MARRTPAQYKWSTQDFDELLLPTTGSGRRSTYPRGGTIKHIDIHHMTIPDSDNGAALLACVQTWKTRQASAHYGIDNDHVAQFVYDDRMAWGNANGTANREGIVIEHANSTLGPKWEISDATIASSVRLVAQLHVTHKLGRPTSSGFGDSGTIRTHQSFYATSCPGPYFKKIWASYVKRVQAEYDRITNSPTVPPVVTPPKPADPIDYTDPNLYPQAGPSTGPQITWLGQRLVVHLKALGIKPAYLERPGPNWGDAIRHDVAAFQTAQGWTGADADGYPGPTTLARLEAAPKMSTPKPTNGPTIRTISQNIGCYNPTGARTYKARAAAFTNAMKSITADIICFQELGNGLSTRGASNARMRPLIDKGLRKSHRRHYGTDGRYTYSSTMTGIKPLKTGTFTAKSGTWFNNDNKQAAWNVYEKDGVRGMDVSVHLESDPGPVADAKRVAQMLNFLAQTLDTAKKYGVDRRNILISGDTNSEGMVADAMAAAKWRNVGKGTDLERTHTFMGWDGRTRIRLDYGFVHDTAAAAELLAVNHDTSISDHAGIVIKRTLTR